MKKFMLLIVMASLCAIVSTNDATAQSKMPTYWGFVYGSFTCDPSGGYGNEVKHTIMSEPFAYCSATSRDDLTNDAFPNLLSAVNAICTSYSGGHIFSYVNGAHDSQSNTQNIINSTTTREMGQGRVVSSFYYQPTIYSSACN